jgi:ABC-type uncharacterized transport system permease subunit
MMSNKSEINVKHVIFENNIKRNVKSIGNIDFFLLQPIIVQNKHQAFIA